MLKLFELPSIPRAAAVELKSIQQSMVSITQQLDKVETR